MNIIARGFDIKKPSRISSNGLINIFRRFLTIKRLEDFGLNKLSRRYIQINELDRIQKLNELSHSVLKKLRELQQIKNYHNLKKEDLICSLLRSKNPNEDNYISSVTTGFDASTLDNEIGLLINDTKQIHTRLGNILTNKERNKMTKELYELLKRITNTNRNTRLRKKTKRKPTKVTY